MKSTKSTHAQVASLIKQELKALNIKASTKSETYSGGSAVRVKVQNQDAKAMQLINEICAKYEYGSFNGMEDIYEYTNTRDDIPQVKYVTVSNELSDDKIIEAIEKVNARFKKDATLEQYKTGNLPQLFENGHWNDFSREIHDVMDGTNDYESQDRQYAREQEVKQALKENHDHDYYNNEVTIYFNDDVWTVRKGYGDAYFSLADDYTLSASQIAKILFNEVQKVKVIVDTENKAYQERQNVLSKEITPISETLHNDELKTLYFPRLNKNNTIEENNEALLHNVNEEVAEITKTIILSADNYTLVSYSLMANRGYLWLENDVVEVINQDDTNDRFYVYPSGYQYARYVGVNAETMARIKAKNILNNLSIKALQY